MNLKAFFYKSVDCIFNDFYVNVDFAQIIGVDCRKHAKMSKNVQKVGPPLQQFKGILPPGLR